MKNKQLRIGLMLGCAIMGATPLYAEINPHHHTHYPKGQCREEEVLKVLKNLAQYEIDASFLLEQAIENVKSKHIRKALIEARHDCEQNIDSLVKLILQHCGTPPAHSKDFKGYFMQGYQTMRGWPSDKSLLTALHTNLRMLDEAYESALKRGLPEETEKAVSQLQAVVQKHLNHLHTYKK